MDTTSEVRHNFNDYEFTNDEKRLIKDSIETRINRITTLIENWSKEADSQTEAYLIESYGKELIELIKLKARFKNLIK